MTYKELIKWAENNNASIGFIDRMERVFSLDDLKDVLLGCDWSWILEMKPELNVYCHWDKLDDEDWKWLLKYQPQLKKYQIK